MSEQEKQKPTPPEGRTIKGGEIKKKGKGKGKPTPPKPKGDETTLQGLINKADSVILVTSTRGNIEVTGLKDVNYSHQAKGLLHGALDTYTTRPVINTVTNLSRGLITNLQNILDEIKKLNPNKEVSIPKELPKQELPKQELPPVETPAKEVAEEKKEG